MSLPDAQAHRHREADDDSDQDFEARDELERRCGFVEKEGRRFWRDGHLWRPTDPDAAARLHKGQNGRKDNFWLGAACHKAVDSYSRATLAVHFVKANVQEWDAYPELLRLTMESIGGTPRAVVTDKGYSIAKLAALNTEHNIATVAALRGNVRCDEHTEFDDFGRPRCSNCQTHMRRVRYTPQRPGRRARVVFKCVNAPEDGSKNGCEKERAITCATAPLHLLPLPPDHPTYQALYAARFDKESTHANARRKYSQAANDFGRRTLAKGIQVLEFRANLGLLMEWIRLLIVEGWADGQRRNKNEPRVLRTPVNIPARVRTQRNTTLRSKKGPSATQSPPG